MGMKVQKSLGYGLKNYEIDEDVLEKIFSMDLDRKKFIQWAKKNKKSIMQFISENHPHIPVRKGSDGGFAQTLSLMSQEKRNWRISDFVTYDCEFGFDDAIVFAPPDVNCRWNRSDDIIDYYEEFDLGDETGLPRIKVLNTCGIFPYVGMVRMKMPQPGIYRPDTDREIFRVLSPMEWRELSSNKSGNRDRISRHFMNAYRPVIPLSVGCLFWFFKDAFKDYNKAYNDLRPMIYVYWR